MIRLPFNLGGGTAYGAADLPSLRFLEDLDKASNPSRILADAGPIPKLAAELLAGKKLYTDQPFMDRMSRTERTPWGAEVRTPNESPGWAQIPGVRQLLEAAGLADTYEDGTPVMTDRTQYTVENLVPLLSRSSKLIPNQEFQQERQLANILSFLGIGVRSNTQGAQDAELRRRQAIEAALAEKEKDLGR